MKRLTVIFVTILLFSSLAIAATEEKGDSAKSVFSGSGSDPTFVKADNLSLNSKDRTFQYNGNVEVKNGDLTVVSQVLDGMYDENNKIKQLIAKNNVLITKGDKLRANSQKAVFDNAAQTVILTENPEMLQKESVLSADQITLYLKEDRSKAEGNVRVKLVKDKGPGTEGETRDKLVKK